MTAAGMFDPFCPRCNGNTHLAPTDRGACRCESPAEVPVEHEPRRVARGRDSGRRTGRRAAAGDEHAAAATVLPGPSNPMAVAREIVQSYISEHCLTLRQWRGGWMHWLRTHWSEVEENEVRSAVYAMLEHAEFVDTTGKTPKTKPWEPTRHKVSDVLDALTAITYLPEDVDPPAWLDAGTAAVPAGELVACENGLLHVGTRDLLSLTPKLFNRVAVPFAYEPDAPAPVRWLEFLDQLWPGDPDAVAALQEFFGYVLSGRTDLHKIMLLIGPTRSGKGTIARVLTALVGAGNAAGPTLASLGTNFGLAPLLDKPLAVVSDARLSGPNVHQVVERLLSISGEDMLTVDRKYKEPWTGKLPTRFLVLSNELPRFGDASGAIARRFIVSTMHASFLGRENPRLTTELLTELPGILGWALDGLDRLSRAGAFTEPSSSADAVTALQDLVSPTAAFVRDKCECRVGAEVGVAALYEAWRSWCEDNGHKPGSVQIFGRDLRSVVPTLRRARPRDGDDRVPSYVGITLRPAHDGVDRGPPRPNEAEPDTSDDGAGVGRDGSRPNPLRAQAAHEGCERCGHPADRLIHGRCRRCAYSAGRRDDDEDPT